MLRFLLCLGLLGAVQDVQAQAPRVVKIGLTVDAVGDVRYGCGVLTAAYRELGWDVEFVRVPPERSLQDSNSGTLDGESPRPPIRAQDAPNLVMVDVPFVRIDHKVMTVHGRKIAFDALRPLRVVIRQGDRLAEAKLANWPALTRAANFQVGLQMLLADHADAMIGFGLSLQDMAERPENSGAEIVLTTAFSTPVYHYVNRRHAMLVPDLTRIFERIRGHTQTVLEGAHKSNFRPPEPVVGTPM